MTPYEREQEEVALKALELTSSFYGVSVEEMKSPTRTAKLANARSVLCYFLYINKGLGVVKIGKLINKHHSSVSIAVQRFSDKCYTDEMIINCICKLRTELKDEQTSETTSSV